MVFQDKKILFSPAKNCVKNLLTIINSVENKEITIVAPSKEFVSSLENIIPKNQKTKIKLLEFNHLASLISSKSITKNELKILTNSQHYHLIQKSIKDSNLDILDFNDSNSLFENIQESIETFLNIPNSVITKLKKQNLKLTHYAIKVFEKYQKLKDTYYDPNQILLEAIKTIESNDHELQNEIGYIIFFLDRYNLPNQIKLISLILKNFSSNLLEVNKNQKTTNDLMKKYSCDTSEIQVKSIENRIKTDWKIVLAKNQIEEVKQAIRKILFAVDKGTQLDKIALTFDDEFPYLEIIKSQLNSAQIPYHGPIEKSLLNTGPGQVLIGLLEIIESGISYRKISNWISNSPVNIFYEDADPNEWNEISKKVGIESNFKTWKYKLFLYANNSKYSNPNDYKKTLQLIKFLENIKTDINSISNDNFNQKDLDLISLFFNKYVDKSKVSNVEKNSFSEIQNIILELNKIENICSKTDKNAYSILTGIGERVLRKYIDK